MAQKKNKQTTPNWLANLRSFMALKELNPRSLSLLAGLNPTAVRDMLEGRTRFPRYDTVQALASALETTPARLMGDAEVTLQTQQDDNEEHLDLLVEIITRLQEEATSLDIQPSAKDFAAMAATIYRQMLKDNGGALDARLSPKIHDLLAYEQMKKRRANG